MDAAFKRVRLARRLDTSSTDGLDLVGANCARPVAWPVRIRPRAARFAIDPGRPDLHASNMEVSPDEHVDGHRDTCEFEARGPFTLGNPVEIGSLSGLALFCKRRDCGSRFVRIAGHLSPLGVVPEGEGSIPLSLTIHLDAGYGIAAGGDEEGDEVLEDAALVESVSKWLGTGLGGATLDLFHQRLLEAKGGAIDPVAWKRLDWSWWTPGTVVAWREVEPDGRLDLYVEAGRCYAAMDYYCANPYCDCTEVKVVLLAPQDERAERRKIGTAISASPSEAWSVSDLGPGVQMELVSALARRFRERHGSERLADRHRRVREVGVELVRRRLGTAVRGAGALVGRRPRPNEPCPCGSGKKFKKCCRDTGT